MRERRCYMASNYKGYLVKVGNYTIPLELIKTQTYKSAMHGQDLDSYRDSNGTLHREALSNFAPKCEFETIPMMTDSQVNSLMKNIRDNYTNEKEKKAKVTMWMQEINKYITHDCYIPDIEFSQYYADKKGIQYESFRIAFISYGGTV